MAPVLLKASATACADPFLRPIGMHVTKNSTSTTHRSEVLSFAVAAMGLAALDAAFIEPRVVRVPRIAVPVERRAEALSALKVAHLSDLHVMGKGWRAATIAAAVDVCNHEDVDLIAITGDFMGTGPGARPALEMVSRLRTDVPRVAVLGNHDHVYGNRYLRVLLNGLKDLGVSVLNNESICLELRSTRLWVTGVDDGYSMRDDLRRALGSGDTEVPRILLTHYPEVAEQLHQGEAQLSLAGHSHAGQIRVPVLAGLVHNGHARTKYSKGLFSVNGNPLFVSSGVGMSGIPMRFLNPPEVPIITFTSPRSEGDERAELDLGRRPMRLDARSISRSRV